VVSPSEARPQDGVANLALWTVVRSDEPGSVVSELTDFMRLPTALQDAVSRSGASTRRPVIVVANTDRARSYYPPGPDGVHHVIDPLVGSEVLPIFVAEGPPGVGRRAFDFVFELHGGDLDHGLDATLSVERAPEGTGFRTGDSVPLREVPEFVEAIAGRIAIPLGP
jgi:hypothetical protein